jgi:phospholipid transport system substrate-binding protein
LVTLSTAFSAPADEALKRAHAGTDEVLALVYDNPNAKEPLSVRSRPVLEKYFDLETITRRAIGPGWNKFSPEQRQKAIKLFSEVVVRTYADRFEPAERPTITYGKPVTLAPDKVNLPTTIGYRGKKYSVVYRIEKASSGDWMVTDVTAEGVSMVANYRAQFDAVYQKGGVDGVLRSLEDSLAKLGPPPK